MRRINGGCCRDAGQKRGITQTQFVGRFPKVALRSLFGSVETRTPIDAVYIEFKDLILAVTLLDFSGQPEFPQFSPVRLTRVQQSILSELLRQRASTLLDFSGAQVRPCRTDNPSQIVSMMVVEIVILHRQDCIPEMFGNP